MIVDVVLKSRIAGGIGPGCHFSMIDLPFGMMSRVQAARTRD
jgi:hypothetical protein